MNWRSREATDAARSATGEVWATDGLVSVPDEVWARLKARWDAGEWTVCLEDDTDNIVDLIATLDR